MNEMVNMILALCKENDELRDALIVGLCGIVMGDDAPVATGENWYDEFVSDDTSVKVKGTTVQVSVKRGHADEWHDKLRSAGFRWSKKNQSWWAYADDDKRAEIAARNREVDALTAGMTAAEKREFWRARKGAAA